MTGHILDISLQENSGVISGSDGVRYHFDRSDWRGDRLPARGMTVNFEAEGNCARNAYPALSSRAGQKSRIATGWLAIIVGGFGIHKFYLGFIGPGLVYVFTNIIGVCFLGYGIHNLIERSNAFMILSLGGVFSFLVISIIPLVFFMILIILRIIAIIEGIIYLKKSDEEFDRVYTIEKRKWF